MQNKRHHKIHDPRGLIGRIAFIREASNLLIEKELKSRGIEGIVPAHGSVLHFLFCQQEPVPIKSLVQQIGRVKSTVTGIVATLERHGYLSRQGCEQDARSVRVSLTGKGLALKKDFEEISRKLLNKVYGEMTEGDRRQLMALLAVIEDNLTA